MRRLNLFQEQSDNNLFVGPDNVLAQSFEPTYDNLAGVRFPIFNPRLGGKENYLMQILDEAKNVVRQETVSESNLGWGGDFRYDFPAITEARNRKFILSVSFQGENSEDGAFLQNINRDRSGAGKSILIDREKFSELEKKYITVLYTKDDRYLGGSASLNQEILSGDLVFQTYYKVGPVDFFRDSLSDFISRTGLDTGFFIFYLLIMSILSVLLIRRLIFKSNNSKR